ncbi:MAG: hypothetical protein VYE15_07920 [Myxococcota bacterium]|nr:hypothetical protein [Myxococcota bacterium]
MPVQDGQHQHQQHQAHEHEVDLPKGPLAGLRAVLRQVSGNFREGEAVVSPQAPVLLKSLFERMDANKDNGIDRDEVKGHLKAIGVHGGFMGMVHSKVSTEFLEKLDQNTDALVTWNEFIGVAKDVLPESIFDSSGAVNMEMLDALFSGMDVDASGDVSREEMDNYTLESLPEGTAHKKIVADIGARFCVAAMDTDASESISREEMLEAAREISRIKEAEVDV